MMTSVLRKTAGIASLCLALGLGAAACTKKAAAVAPPPPPMATAPATPPPPPAPPPPPPAAPAPPRVLTEDEIFARKTASDLNDERVLAHVFFDLDSSAIRDDAPIVAHDQRDLPQALAERAFHGRRTLRRARHRGIQPRAWASAAPPR